MLFFFIFLFFVIFFFFFFNDTATTEIYTLSLHDALPICHTPAARRNRAGARPVDRAAVRREPLPDFARSEEHTSELQSQSNLVCRLLLEKKKKKRKKHTDRITDETNSVRRITSYNCSTV